MWNFNSVGFFLKLLLQWGFAKTGNFLKPPALSRLRVSECNNKLVYYCATNASRQDEVKNTANNRSVSLKLLLLAVKHQSNFMFRSLTRNFLCTLFSVLCSLFSVLCSLYSVLCTLFSVLCSLYSVLCSLYSVLCFRLSNPRFYPFVLPFLPKS